MKPWWRTIYDIESQKLVIWLELFFLSLSITFGNLQNHLERNGTIFSDWKVRRMNIDVFWIKA